MYSWEISSAYGSSQLYKKENGLFLVDIYNAIALVLLLFFGTISMYAVWPAGVVGLAALASIVRLRNGSLAILLALLPLILVFGNYVFMEYYSPMPVSSIDYRQGVYDLMTVHDRPIVLSLSAMMFGQIAISIWVIMFSLPKLRSRVALLQLALFMLSSYISLKALELHLWDGLS